MRGYFTGELAAYKITLLLTASAGLTEDFERERREAEKLILFCYYEEGLSSLRLVRSRDLLSP